MIFIDESGDDGDTEKSSQRFFIVTAFFSSLEKSKEENNEVRKFLNFEKTEMKWNKLTKIQKELFNKYSKKISYKIDYIYLDKNSNGEIVKYYNLVQKLLDRNRMFLNNELILYKGEHLKKMFEKIRREFLTYGTKLKHREIKIDESCGIEIADLWAGYLHSKLKLDN